VPLREDRKRTKKTAGLSGGKKKGPRLGLRRRNCSLKKQKLGPSSDRSEHGDTGGVGGRGKKTAR